MSLNATALTTLTEAKSYLRIDAAASLNIPAEYVGVGDGTDKTFDLDNTPVTGSLKLYVNGVLQVETTNYSISTATITFVTAPTLNHPITANYDTAASDNTFENWDDASLERMINAATNIVENYAGRVFIARTVIETRNGNGDELLFVGKRPLISVTTLTLDDTSFTEDTDYEILEGMDALKRSVYWNKDYEIIITYIAGDCANLAAVRTSYPQAEEACLLVLADLYENRGDKVSQESITGLGSTTYSLPSRAMTILQGLDPTGGMA